MGAIQMQNARNDFQKKEWHVVNSILWVNRVIVNVMAKPFFFFLLLCILIAFSFWQLVFCFRWFVARNVTAFLQNQKKNCNGKMEIQREKQLFTRFLLCVCYVMHAHIDVIVGQSIILV